MLYWFLGLIVGIVVTCIVLPKFTIGTLKHVQDEEGTYFYMELNDPNIEKIHKKKYVILDVSHD